MDLIQGLKKIKGTKDMLKSGIITIFYKDLNNSFYLDRENSDLIKDFVITPNLLAEDWEYIEHIEFTLVEFLKENLKPKKFVDGADNYIIYFNTNKVKWEYAARSYSDFLIAYFERFDFDYVVDILNINQVTTEQLKEAYKELGWL